MSAAFVAVDLGATSGRVMLALLPVVEPVETPVVSTGSTTEVSTGSTTATVELVEVARFPNGPLAVPRADGETDLRWDVLGLWRGVVDGLREAGREAERRGARVLGVGVDSWAVDHGLLDADGVLLAAPRCYRDPRILGAAERAYATVPRRDHYEINGLQHLAFTTEFQLVAGATDAVWSAARSLLLIPDLMTFWLTGHRVAEVTNASTTGLLDVRRREWSAELLGRLGSAFDELATLPDLLPELVEPGTVVGPLLPAVREATGLGAVPVVAVASHDTASAVAAIPLGSGSTHGNDGSDGGDDDGDRVAAYISSGTWSLVGLELDAPVLTDASREANFTNELGLDGTVRYLRNVMGLWVLDECVREWERTGDPVDVDGLLAAAAAEPGGRCVVDIDGDAFLAPGDMPRRFADAAQAAGQEVPTTRAALARAVLDSLAAAYARAISRAAELAGVRVSAVHVAGGGARNRLLCRLTADATGLPVVAGPVEAAALGNALVQARAVGVLDGGLDVIRAVVAAGADLVVHRPRAAGPTASR